MPGDPLDRGDNLGHLAGAEHRVDLRNLFFQLVAVALGQATGNDQTAARSVLLLLHHFENGVDRLLLRRVDERARVDDEDIGFAGISRELVSGLLRQPEHHLRIHEILRAAQGDETYFHKNN